MDLLQTAAATRRVHDQVHNAAPPLILRKADGFWARLRGLHALPCLPWHTGLHLSPCRAIHTFGMAYAIDVVFLNGCGKPVKQIGTVMPNRVAFCLRAASVVELPAGYCLEYPGYASAIERCLHPCRCPHRHRPRSNN
ncbi:hypothetical protein CR159_12815 [Pollutimonas subterranea]|uniref:DUF192 domain-containing protein n=1 Tax=Pollutimonas subterranea TaxID=2045210 RepID=A0A2N4U391_9BURK|nr:hypothetical protein CR159_12815 [Pollutimonas subterranea]